jgi:peptide/nickel transport system substrate-binding protein
MLTRMGRLGRLGRRAALRAGFGLGLGAVTSGLLTACGQQAPAPAKTEPKPPAQPTAAPAAKADLKPAEGTPAAPAGPQATPAARAAAQAAQPAGRLVVRIGDMQSPDPHRETGSFHWPQATTEGLTGVAADGSVKPMLAERWEIPDARTYVFHLRPGVRFHNGRELTAEDVKANFERIAGLDRAWLKSTAAMVEAYEIGGPHTLTMRLKEPYAPFLALVSEGWIMAPESPNWSGTISAPIGTGPFVWREFVPKTELKLTRHDAYWRAPMPHVAEVVGRFSEGDPVVGLRAGDVHIAGVSQDQAAALANDPAVAVITGTASSWQFLSFNNRAPRPPLDDVRVRRAIVRALDKQKIIEIQGGPTAVVANQMALPGSFYHDPNLADALVTPDLPAARALLAEAGVDPARHTLVMPVNTNPTVPQVVAAMIGELGFQIDLQVADDAATETRLQKYDWDLYYAGSGPRTDIALRFLRMLSDGPNPGLWGGVQDPEYDRIVRRAFATVDDGQRRALYLEAWARVMDRLYTHVIGHTLSSYGVRREVEGFEMGAVPGVSLVDTGLAFARLR